MYTTSKLFNFKSFSNMYTLLAITFVFKWYVVLMLSFDTCNMLTTFLTASKINDNLILDKLSGILTGKLNNSFNNDVRLAYYGYKFSNYKIVSSCC